MKHIPGKVKDKYEILGIIGEGAYGVVLKARKKDSDRIVAIKHFKQAPGYSSDTGVIDRELKILQSLRFENVVELIEWFRDKKRCFLIFEYVEWNMLQVLQEHPEGLPLEQVRRLSYQLFSAIYWCHLHDIIHRDIKPENLLISKNFVLKLCDFGFARFCNKQASADYYTDYVATRWYRSPELLIGTAYGKPVDLWACGCIMSELATGQALFAGESDIDQLYRIQKCLGPLPSKYMEAMRANPKFEGLKFPPIQHLETLERRFGYTFPPDIMHLFKNTLRLYSNDRLTAEQCIQHEAYVHLKGKHFQHRPYLDSTSPSPIDHHLSKSYHENGEPRSPPITCNMSLSIPQQIKYRSDEQKQPSILSPRSVNNISDDDENCNDIHIRRKHLSPRQQIPSSSTMKYASNGVLLRTKQQHSTNILQTSPNDIGKTIKRYSLDQYQQQIPESNIYRSSMAIISSQNPANQNVSLSHKQIREESNNDLQRTKTREVNRDVARSRTVDCHPPVETTRTSSRQSHHPDPMNQADIDSMVSSTYHSSRNLEQQQSHKYPWNSDQRRPVYGSDSHLLSSNGHNASFSRPFYSPTKGDYTYINRVVITPQRGSSYDPNKSSKQNTTVYPKTPNESNRRQQSSTGLFSAYPFARIAQAIIPSSNQRQQSIRHPNTKSRHHDH